MFLIYSCHLLVSLDVSRDGRVYFRNSKVEKVKTPITIFGHKLSFLAQLFIYLFIYLFFIFFFFLHFYINDLTAVQYANSADDKLMAYLKMSPAAMFTEHAKY